MFLKIRAKVVKLNFLWFCGHLWKMARLDGRLWKIARLDGRLWKIARLTPVFVILPVFLWFSACSGHSWAVWQTDQERSECALNHKITAKSQLLIFFAEKVPVYYISFPNPNEGHITEWLRMSISIMLQDAKSTGIAGGGKPIHCGNINTTISQTLHLISLASPPLSIW